MAIYQFLIAVRSSGGPNQQSFLLTNADGETTSHIQGLFNRTIRFLTEGIRPVFVFDGKPPQLKSHELSKRREKREKAQAALQVAQEDQNVAELDKQSKRLVRAGQKENEDCQTLLRLMGVPVVLAPCEAEAQAAALAKAGKVYAVGTEDMDALTFATPVLLRKMTFANASKSMIQTIQYDKAIAGLNLTHAQFVDLCILLGCDYCDTIKGVGPKTALKLIREHGNIETILENIDRTKFTVPDSWIPASQRSSSANKEGEQQEQHSETEDEESPPTPSPTKETAKDASNDGDEDENFLPAFVQARQLFLNHEVLSADDDNLDLKWKACDADKLRAFLVDDMGFNPDRVQANITKLQAAHKANTKPQTRMDAFFTVKSTSKSSTMVASAAAASKRKGETTKGGSSVKKGKTAGKRK